MISRKNNYMARNRLHKVYATALATYKVLYICASAGYGKTTSVESWLASQELEYSLYNAEDDSFLKNIETHKGNANKIVVIDNLSSVQNQSEQSSIFQYILNSKAKFILISRIKDISYLMPLRIVGQLTTVGEEELAFTAEELNEYVPTQKVALSNDEKVQLYADTRGMPIYIAISLHYIKNSNYGPEVYEKMKRDYFHYLDYALLNILIITRLTIFQYNYFYEFV